MEKIQGRFEEISFIEGPEQSMRVLAKALKNHKTKSAIKSKNCVKNSGQALLKAKIFLI